MGELRGRCLRSGDYLLHQVSATQSRSLLNLTHILNTEIRVTVFKRQGPFQGIVRGVPRRYTDEKLMECWRPSEVSTVKILDSSKHTNSTAERLEELTRTVLITFTSSVLPPRLTLGFLSLPVLPYQPPPIQCHKCLRFGHVKVVCRHPQACGWCAGAHAKSDCTKLNAPPRCSNCRGQHPASAASCKFRRTAQSVVTEVLATGRPYMEVRKEVRNLLHRPLHPSSRLHHRKPRQLRAVHKCHYSQPLTRRFHLVQGLQEPTSPVLRQYRPRYVEYCCRSFRALWTCLRYICLTEDLC